MNTLLGLTERMQQLGSREALLWSNGFRTWKWTYADVYRTAGAFAHWLDDQSIAKGDRMMLWGENCGEWLAAFWAAVSRGVAVVPIDFRFSRELAARIALESGAKLLVHDDIVDAAAIPLSHFSFNQFSVLPNVPLPAGTDIHPDDIVEIVYTSGTTGEPKGVIHRHRNITANLAPFQSEIEKYRRLAAPFQPIRILNLLPLSHMFGQSMGLFIPVLLGGSVVFSSDIVPHHLIRMTHDEHISVIVAVPRMLETLHADIVRRFSIPSPPKGAGLWGVAARWWRYRRIHDVLGWKFWAFVVGGARLDPELESFWGRLGFLVIQGYGLTEASPVVAVNHPFDARRGSLGKVVPGQDVTIAPDGEILVRGESVTNDDGGWLHTGDIGSIDSEGRLYFRGRKKDLIVTSEGLNVHPLDVESVLNGFAEIKDSAVVAVKRDGREQVHAVLILNGADVDAESIVHRANEKLESHQRIQSWTVWPEPDFPRTPSTLKVRRNEIAAQIANSTLPASGQTTAPAGTLERVLKNQNSVRLSEDLGLSSLDRVELMAELEAQSNLEIDEEQFSKTATVGDLKHWLNKTPSLGRETVQSKSKSWTTSSPVRLFRSIGQRGLVLPVFRHYIPLEVSGLEHLNGIEPPVLFAANHSSHLDTVAILAALPPAWRKFVAPAMSPEHFRAWFQHRSSISGLQYFLARTLFNAYPLPQEMAGVKRALEFTGELVSRGWCPLVYPEGHMTPDGKIHEFRPGIGMMATRLQVPVVPIRIEGLFEVFPSQARWPKPGPVRVTFGSSARFSSTVPVDRVTKEIDQAVRSL